MSQDPPVEQIDHTVVMNILQSLEDISKAIKAAADIIATSGLTYEQLEELASNTYDSELGLNYLTAVTIDRDKTEEEWQENATRFDSGIELISNDQYLKEESEDLLKLAEDDLMAAAQKGKEITGLASPAIGPLPGLGEDNP
jgi:hypothetical protein